MIFYVITLFIFSLIYLFLFVYLFKNKNTLSTNFIFYSLAYFVYLLGTIGVLFSKSTDVANAFQNMKYFGMFFIAPTFVIFLYELNFNKIKKSFVYLIYLVPVLSLIFVSTNEIHQLFYSNPELITYKGFSFLTYNKEIMYYIHCYYYFGLNLYSLILIYFLFKNKNKAYLAINILILINFIITLPIEILYFFEVFRPGLDIMMFANVLQLVIYCLVIFYFKIFKSYQFNDTIVPLLTDGVFILDEKDNLVYHNKFASKYLSWFSNFKIGDNLKESPIKEHIVKKDSQFILKCIENKETLYYKFKMSISNENDLFNGPLYTYIFNDETEQVIIKNELERMIKLDGLTNIYNQSSILKKIEEKFIIAKENKTTFSAIILDINDFKNVNDQYGHLAGNRVLIKVANEITNYFSCSKCVRGRFGGDEFIMATYKMPKNIFLERLKGFSEAISNFNEPSIDKMKITTSIGVGFIDFGKTDSLYTHLDIIDIADKAMYDSKKENNYKPVIKFIK